MSLQYLTRDQLERLALDLDRENDDLRRENESLRRGHVGRIVAVNLDGTIDIAPGPMLMSLDDAPETTRQQESKLPEMCCGGTCVRAVCFIHGPQGAKT